MHDTITAFDTIVTGTVPPNGYGDLTLDEKEALIALASGPKTFWWLDRIGIHMPSLRLIDMGFVELRGEEFLYPTPRRGENLGTFTARRTYLALTPEGRAMLPLEMYEQIGYTGREVQSGHRQNVR